MSIQTLSAFISESPKLVPNVIITGKHFNQHLIHSHTCYVKLTNFNENHNGFIYKTGLNIDVNIFDSNKDTCGLYFIEYNDIKNWINYSDKIGVMVYFREVAIPDDAFVFIMTDGTCKTNKFILSKKQYIWNNLELCDAIINHNIHNTKYFDIIDDSLKMTIFMNYDFTKILLEL
jgi:hypothetical protein